LWLTLITTGLRRGEALGLRWQDVDLAARTLAIRQTRVLHGYQPLLSTPKTRKGRRLVALDPATAACLQGLHEQQQAKRGEGQDDHEDADLVFTNENGQPIHPERATTLFMKAAQAAGVPRIRLHDLRHTHATPALSAGVHPKIVSERLGHANIGITLDTYSHCLPALSEEAARRVAALVVPA
jgi:integrase